MEPSVSLPGQENSEKIKKLKNNNLILLNQDGMS